MSDEESVDIEQELEELLTKEQPNLQDVIKRSFTNVAVQQTKNGEQTEVELLEDTCYFAKNTQVNLSRLELVKIPSFHVQSLSLDLKSLALTFRCSVGEVAVKGIYSAYNENLYNLVPVMSEGHVLITLSNVIADVAVGLIIEEDEFAFINPGMEFLHEEVTVKLSWPSPQKSGGYEFVSTEQSAKHIDELPLSSALALPLWSLLRRRLLRQLSRALRRAAGLSDLMSGRAMLLEAYMTGAQAAAGRGARVLDAVLVNVRRTLLQAYRETLPLSPLCAAFRHKVGVVWTVGKLESEAGLLRGLHSVARGGDVSLRCADSARTHLAVTFTINDLQLCYEQYRARCGGVSCGGRVQLALPACGRLALVAGLADWAPYCHLTHLSLHSIQGTDLHITGLGPLSSLAPRVLGWCRGAVAAAVAPLTTRLQDEIHTALEQLPLWDILHGKQ